MNDDINVDELKRIDIVALAEKVGFTVAPRGGGKFTTKEHDSLVLFPRDNSWHRFSDDDAGGDTIAFLMYWQRLDFKTACTELQNFAGILPARTIAPRTPAAPTTLPADLHMRYHAALTDADRAWWMEHYGLSEQAIDRFKLGVCRDGFFAPVTYTIPILAAGKLVSLKHRIPGAPDGGKYRSHQKGLGTHLFNGDILTPDLRGVVIVAGELKAITLTDHGIPAVSTTGGCGHWSSAWNERFTACDRVYIAYDPEPPSEQVHARELAAALGDRARLVDCPQKPDDYVLAEGAAMFRGLLKIARTLKQAQAWDAAMQQARQTVRI